MFLKKFALPRISIHFLIFIIIAKLVYLFFESYYNGYVIDIVTSTNITKEILEDLEFFGNKISSIGLTLLLMPFFYLVAKKLFESNQELRALVVVIATLLTFLGLSRGLYHTVDVIIEKHQDKRYESYYIEMFKYGMLTGKLGYSSFIPKQNLENMSIYDKVMISNLFLLTQFDKELIDKFVGIGKEKFFDIYVHKYFKDHYEIEQDKVDSMVNEIETQWQLYSADVQKINKKFSKIESQSSLDKKYDTFKTDLDSGYERYRTNIQDYVDELNSKTAKTQEIQEYLGAYFSENKNERSAKVYAKIMNKYFAKHYPTSTWCAASKCPSLSKIENIIEQELLEDWNLNNNYLPLNLTKNSYYKSSRVRKTVIQDLQEKGILVDKSFNYSKKSFQKAYLNSQDARFNSAKRKFQKQFTKSSGIKNIPFGLRYTQFVSYYKKDIYAFYSEKRYAQQLYAMIKQRDMSNFYDDLYKPRLRVKYYDQAFPSVEEFDIKLAEVGDKAIKMLYIPPFGVAVSLFAGMMNFISVVVLLAFLPWYSKEQDYTPYIKGVIKVTLLGVLLYAPYKIGTNNSITDRYPLLATFDTPQYEAYINSLNWLLVVENINYEMIYTPIRETHILDDMFTSASSASPLGDMAETLTGIKKEKVKNDFWRQ